MSVLPFEKGCDSLGSTLCVVLPWYLSLGVVIDVLDSYTSRVVGLMLLQAYSLVIGCCKCVGLFLSCGIM